MGMKLKSGADLCGFQLTNFCVQGEASAPSDAALGRKYFHTNATDDVATGISLLNRERIYLGEGAWRATAYLDDIAAINEKLNLITGDTDTDTLINNLKDLEEFLKDFSETDKLKSLLDGKLDKSGGTIRGTYSPLVIQRQGDAVGVAIEYKSDVRSFGYIGAGIKDGVIFPFFDNGTTNTIIHSGNIGSQSVASAKEVIDSVELLKVRSNALYVGYGSAVTSSLPTYLWGNGINFINGAGHVSAIINSSGNVTIGGSDLAGTDCKLYVDGKARLNEILNIHEIDTKYRLTLYEYEGVGRIYAYDEDTWSFRDLWIGNNSGDALQVKANGNVLIGPTTDNGAKLQVAGNICLKEGYFFFSGDAATGASNMYLSTHDAAGLNFRLSTGATRFFIATGSGNVGIGTTDPKYKLDVNGNAHISGNLIVDGEISAGGAGAEGGTSGSGSAEGVSEIFTPTSTSMVFNHNLGEDVIVQVYEKSGNVWNMVMVDVEITSATKVTLRFGKTETTQHKVVIMGV